MRAVSSVWESATMALWRSPVRPRYGPRMFSEGQSRRLSFFLGRNMVPTKISLESPDRLSILWNDGHNGVVTLQTLRDSCPCAGCQGETVLLRTFKPLPQPELPGRYALKSAHPVGSYALQVVWGDGHATGLYTWPLLRSLCSCPQCIGAGEQAR